MVFAEKMGLLNYLTIARSLEDFSALHFAFNQSTRAWRLEPPG
jgi:hypothetical protein